MEKGFQQIFIAYLIYKDVRGPSHLTLRYIRQPRATQKTVKQAIIIALFIVAKR